MCLGYLKRTMALTTSSAKLTLSCNFLPVLLRRSFGLCPRHSSYTAMRHIMVSQKMAKGPNLYRCCRSSAAAVAASFSTSAKTQGSTVFAPPKSLMRPLDFPRKLLMGPGPSNPTPRVAAAGALPLLGHLHPELIKIMDEVKEGIQYAFQTKNEWTFAISGSGHAAMEASIVNLLEPGEVALVCQNGIWGQRIADMTERNGSVARKLIRPMGEVFTLSEIEKGLKEYKPSLVFVTYGESSAGTAQPLEGLGDLCYQYGALLLVDSVAIVGGRRLFMDDWHIDAMYAGSQKCLSSAPAPSPISFSPRARDKILNRKTRVSSYYFDGNALASHWGCNEGHRGYHHTELCTNVYMLREGLARLAEEGLEKSWHNHKVCSELLYEGLEKLGLEFLVKDKENRNPCITTILVPEGIHWKDVIDYAMQNYRVEISGGLEELAGKVWRIGIMGNNCTQENVQTVLRVLGEALEKFRK